MDGRSPMAVTREPSMAMAPGGRHEAKDSLARAVPGVVGALMLVPIASGSGVGPALLAASSVGTAFTYQSKLQVGGTPVNGPCDFGFKLFDA